MIPASENVCLFLMPQIYHGISTERPKEHCQTILLYRISSLTDFGEKPRENNANSN
jgi:hypothetical protein